VIHVFNNALETIYFVLGKVNNSSIKVDQPLEKTKNKTKMELGKTTIVIDKLVSCLINI